ncbi:hypothetical protein CDAR_471111 [Caerostris darwini]|uniref:Uncharacterized protein n=1 Tax=Caerostris darwini TaxID=1538125 RepID=A0AAV4QRK2_9ARAC|nr:hypothetical protein CDAR_471111 [Caerostris darwini]
MTSPTARGVSAHVLNIPFPPPTFLYGCVASVVLFTQTKFRQRLVPRFMNSPTLPFSICSPAGPEQRSPERKDKKDYGYSSHTSQGITHDYSPYDKGSYTQKKINMEGNVCSADFWETEEHPYPLPPSSLYYPLRPVGHQRAKVQIRNRLHKAKTTLITATQPMGTYAINQTRSNFTSAITTSISHLHKYLNFHGTRGHCPSSALNEEPVPVFLSWRPLADIIARPDFASATTPTGSSTDAQLIAIQATSQRMGMRYSECILNTTTPAFLPFIYGDEMVSEK